MTQCELVTAAELEERGILKKGTAYRMAKLSLIPFARIGPKRRGIRFSPHGVLIALKQPAVSEGMTVKDLPLAS
jgi:hypothetical protein